MQMGAAGSLGANRVLLLAYIDGHKLAGACSSTFSVPWAAEGCGHWGLLVSDTAMRGRGVASALVAVAEHRIASKCTAVRMEYEFVPKDPHSERYHPPLPSLPPFTAPLACLTPLCHSLRALPCWLALAVC